jgi:hypothetical protein
MVPQFRILQRSMHQMVPQFRVLAKVDEPNDPAYYFISGRMLGLNE